MERASGEYIGFLDSDDWLELNMYERMYSVAKKENADVVFCNAFFNDEEKERHKVEALARKFEEKYVRFLSWATEQPCWVGEVFRHFHTPLVVYPVNTSVTRV